MLGPTITVAFSVATLPTFALTVAPGLGGASVAGTLAAAYGAGHEAAGAAAQLGINLVTIVVAGVCTLFVQRRLYVRRRRKHLEDPARKEADLPMGRRLKEKTTRPASSESSR